MSKTLLLGRTGFKADKVAWVARRGLSRQERVCKWALLLGGVVFFFTLGYAKANYFSLEGLFSLVPVLVALGMRTEAKLASTGDSAELYGERLVQPGSQFEQLAAQLRPDCVEVGCREGNYHYLLNPNEIHSFSPWYSVNLKPLRVAWIFGLYAFLVGNHWQFPKWPGLAELQLLVYQPGSDHVLFWVVSSIAVLGLITVAASCKRGLKLAASGGVVERLFLHTVDRLAVIAALKEGWGDSQVAQPS